MTRVPAASVVVPTYGRPEGLRRCITALLAQTAGDLEVIVVDDGGVPAAAETLAGVADDRLRVVRQDNAGPAAARNHGGREARAELLAFTDDDCAPRPDWLATLRDAWRATPEAMVGGVTHNALANRYSAASQALIDHLYDTLNADRDDAVFLTSNNIALARTAFLDLRGFDEAYPLAAGEDRAWCRRWRAAGRRIRLIPAAIVDHHHGLTARSYWRQHVNYGRGGQRFRATAEANADGRLGKLGNYLRLMTRPLPRRPDLCALLALSQVATTVGTIREARAGCANG